MFGKGGALSLLWILLASSLHANDGMGGDAEYGAYLASECVTCHQDGTENAIPHIAGMSTEYFTKAMRAYRDKSRDNWSMQLIAARLSDTEIAALAAYFATLQTD